MGGGVRHCGSYLPITHSRISMRAGLCCLEIKYLSKIQLLILIAPCHTLKQFFSSINLDQLSSGPNQHLLGQETKTNHPETYSSKRYSAFSWLKWAYFCVVWFNVGCAHWSNRVFWWPQGLSWWGISDLCFDAALYAGMTHIPFSA